MVLPRNSAIAAVLAAILLVLPTTVAGQVPYLWVMPGIEEEIASTAPFAMILDQRDALSLSAGQVTRIENVRERLVEENRPLMAQIRDAEVMGVDDEEARARLEVVRGEFVANAEDAEAEVRQILSAPQLEQAGVLLGGASWTYPVREDPAETRSDGALEPVMLTVENHNFLDANVYVVSGARRERLGFVTGLNTQRFEIPEGIVAANSGVRFEVQQIPRFRLPLTPEISLFPGNQVVLRIPPS